MLGFIFLLLTIRQIYIIIRNGLTARQVKEATTGEGCLVIVNIKKRDLVDDSFLQKMQALGAPHDVRFIVPLDHPQILEMNSKGLQTKEFNSSVESHTDMINKIIEKTSLQSILICDTNIEFEGKSLFGLEKLLTDNKGPFVLVPQVRSSNLVIECLYNLNPNLALLSLINFKKLVRATKKTFVEVSELGIFFRKSDYSEFQVDPDWKKAILQTFHQRNIVVKLCFGEKLFSIRLLPDFKALWNKMGRTWFMASKASDYTTTALLAQTIVWGFPIIFLKIYPFYAFLILFFLIIYRIFTVIIFQENVLTLVLHPFSSLLWLASFIWDKIRWAAKGA